MPTEDIFGIDTTPIIINNPQKREENIRSMKKYISKIPI